jgi:hypothetical protein
MKTSVVILVGAVFLLLVFLVRSVYFVEGFEEPPICSKLTTKSDCTKRADCIYDEKSSKCLACTDISDCAACADSDKCGWCGDVNQCVLLNRYGTPAGKECSAQRVVRYASQCRSKNPNYDVPVSSELLDTTGGEVDDTYGRAAGGTSGGSVPPLSCPSCPSSEKVAEIAKKKIEDSIKTLVRNELTAQGVKLTEGFTADENISKMVVSSMTDDIRKMVKDAVIASKAQS